MKRFTPGFTEIRKENTEKNKREIATYTVMGLDSVLACLSQCPLCCSRSEP